jgi:hypothetical protein
MNFTRAVCQVEPGNIHATADKPFDGPGGTGSRANGANYLRARFQVI